jgi:hypothetical protein
MAWRVSWSLALGDEQPRQIVLAGGQVSLDRTQLVAGNGVLDAEAAFETSDPQPRPLNIELAASHLYGFADPQAVPVNHEQKDVVTNAVACPGSA